MIPKYLSDYAPTLQIVRGRDYGPISKLFCSLKNESDDDTIIVTCDDDLKYNKEWLNELIINSARLPDSAVGFRGRMLSEKSLRYRNTKVVSCKGVKTDTEVDIVTAVRGWAYRRKFFGNSFIHEWERVEKKHPFIFFNDDIWISGQFEKMKRKKMVVSSGKAGSENMRLHGSSLIKSPGQHTRTNNHIMLFKKYWQPKLETYLRSR
jgi:hypothetical protein